MNAQSKDWIDLAAVEDIPLRGSRVVKAAKGDLALFRLSDGDVVAVEDRCPHRGGPLSQGIVHGRAVTCPLHNWVIDLDSGEVRAPDHGCVRTLAVRIENGRVLLAV
ncbi:MAG: nitrite reductase small subunit NirD [Hyphomicrobiaceae bacterium]|nr:nitrite reductase small subunit NirD [Hyphomicrobiaceae bacterium]